MFESPELSHHSLRLRHADGARNTPAVSPTEGPQKIFVLSMTQNEIGCKASVLVLSKA